jgi:hypothetical protein
MVHALNLTIRPGMVRLPHTVFDPVPPAHPVERVAAKARRGAASVPDKVKVYSTK